jgi:hypothetical protein
LTSPQTDRQQSVLNLLQNLKGQDQLKQLFWTELSYDKANSPLSRKGWGEQASGALAEDPVLFALGAKDFHVIHARLKSDRLLMGDERPIVSKLLQEHPYALFVFSNAKQDHFHFLNVKYDNDLAKRRLFRRITIGPHERLRTASECISQLDLAEISPTLFGLTPLSIQDRHDNAFDVAPVQKQFFKVFADIYEELSKEIAATRGLEAQSKGLAELLLNRLLFLYFIQKKGWLDQQRDYLYARFKECWRKSPDSDSYYSTVLNPIFENLSTRHGDDEYLGVVPFLNGGLFEQERATQSQRVARARISIGNRLFRRIFQDLLERFNFTVTEDTPFDVEVAIDPEMLGKIFESLILQMEVDPEIDLRKLTGSYYTPRPIVHFICQQSLAGYLLKQFNDREPDQEPRARIERLLELPPADQLDEDQEHELLSLFNKHEAAALRAATLSCRICDPAVGSGAFPVGMLHEMTSVIGRLDRIVHGAGALYKRNYDYETKKTIIENCLYGVDVQEEAVRLCELRLWLSLIVDYQIDKSKAFATAIHEIPTLPNLSYRIIRGDSLLERLFGTVTNIRFLNIDQRTQQVVDSIRADKAAFFQEADVEEKRRIEMKVLSKQADLAERLVDIKAKHLLQHNLTLFGESAKDTEARESREAEEQALSQLRQKIHNVRLEIERVSEQGQARGAKGQDASELRRRLFRSGDSPTFLWHIDFAEVFSEKGGFDLIIANPPYIRVHNLRPELKTELWANFTCFKAKADLYACFVERSITLLNNEGSVSFICSDGWQRLDSYVALRQYILRNCSPSLLLDLRFSVFEEAQVKVSIFRLNRRLAPEPDSGTVRFASIQAIGDLDSAAWSEIPIAHFQKAHKNIFDTSWSPRSEGIIKQLWSDSDKLGACLDVAFGLKTGDDSMFLTHAKKTKSHKPLVRGENVSRYDIVWDGEYVDYRPQAMRAHRTTARPGEAERFECEKVLVRDTSSILECSVDFDHYYAKDLLIVRSADDSIPAAFVAGILNSSLMRWYYQRIFPTIHVQADELRSLPFRRPEAFGNNAARLIKLVKERQNADDSSRAKIIEEQIDTIVFDAFGLSEDDAALVRREL